jgi:hypothetical protein
MSATFALVRSSMVTLDAEQDQQRYVGIGPKASVQRQGTSHSVFDLGAVVTCMGTRACINCTFERVHKMTVRPRAA